MKRRAFESMIAFCLEQQLHCNASAWLTNPEVLNNKENYAVAAKFLSLSHGYGHQAALATIAATLMPEIAIADGFERIALAVKFDFTKFSSHLEFEKLEFEKRLKTSANRLEPVS